MPVNIQFLNVGHGDCTIIEHDSGRLTMIDINNGSFLDDDTSDELAMTFGITPSIAYYVLQKDMLTRSGYRYSLTDPVEFLSVNYPGRGIFRYIQTHPDLDHMRGLAALRQAGIPISNFWDTRHSKNPDLRDSDRADWSEYHRLRSGEAGAKVLQLNRGDCDRYWADDGLEVLSPFPNLTKWANNNQNSNELSYVLRLNHCGISVVFGGDAETQSWSSLVELDGTLLKCNVLKASHHGRDSGYYQPAVELMAPDLVIVSVGKKPDTDASNKYRNYAETVLSTRWGGNIRLQIADNGTAMYNSDN